MADSHVTPDLDRSLLANLTLSRAGLDRAAHLRFDEAAWLQATSNPHLGVVVVHGSRVPVTGEHPALLRTPLSEVVWPHTLVLLAHDGNDYVVGALVPRETEVDLPAADRWGDLRELGAVVNDTDAGLLVTAVALSHWHASHTHCPTCGAPTTVGQAGWVRVCAEHGEQHPRTDAAVIVLVRDADDRALLGRRGEWTTGWYSTLAGFVEAGESAEQAVAREVMEEAGVPVNPNELIYLGSQPWPFPRSLMLGYHAFTSDPDAARPDGEEITEVRWFTREQLAAGCASGEVRIPPRVSVARRLIERWYGAELPGEWSRP